MIVDVIRCQRSGENLSSVLQTTATEHEVYKSIPSYPIVDMILLHE